MATSEQRQDGFLTLRETADLLGISANTLYAWRYRGEGPVGYRLNGGRVRFRRSDVLAWLETQRDPERAPASV